MSINALKEFLIHFHTYRNVDLINQGLYQIRARINYIENNVKYYAIPYFYSDSKGSENLFKCEESNVKPHNIISNHISENYWEYVSKTFLIRYYDEEVEIDEFCYFRLELPSNLLKKKILYHVEFELFFSDALLALDTDRKGNNSNTQSNQNQNNVNPNSNNNNNVLNNVEFKSASSHTSFINYDSECPGYIESFNPVVYSDSFFSILNSSIHMVILDYKLRINNFSAYSNNGIIALDSKDIDIRQSIKKSNKNENTTALNLKDDNTSIYNSNSKSFNDKNNDLNLNNYNSNNSKNIKNKSKSDLVNGNENINSLIQFFLEEKILKMIDSSLSAELVDELYDSFVVVMIKNYFSLRKKYERLMNKLIDNKIKSEFPFFIIIQPLNVYFDERDKEFLNQDMEIFDENIFKKAKFSRRVIDYSCDYIASRILMEINFIGCQIYQLWHKYIEMIRYFPMQTNFILSTFYFNSYREDLTKFIKKSIIKIEENNAVLYPIENNLQEFNKNLSKEIREALIRSYQRPKIENINNFINPSIFPILFEEVFPAVQKVDLESRKSLVDMNFNLNESEKDKINNFFDADKLNKKTNSIGLHLVVLVHGFQGNAYDMRLIKNTISLINPSIVFMSSRANEDKTENDILEMGKTLANEVRNSFKEWNDIGLIRKISFIGHSIGGLIIRACLPHLFDLSKKMWMYMSLSSPHLGYMYTTSKLIDAGLWILKKWKKSKSLEQLCLTDTSQLNETCLYKLSEFSGLNWFKHVYLISSHQDLYAPFESTRIQFCNKSMDDSYKANVYRNMAFNLLSKIPKECLKRIDVNFIINEKNIDSFIGRTAHIQFLENQHFMKLLFFYMDEILK